MLFEPLKAQGWLVEEVSWRKPDVDWNNYDVVVIRTTWDYQDDVEGFMACLRRIEASSAQLQNSLKIVEWNISKRYLKDLQNQEADKYVKLKDSYMNYSSNSPPINTTINEINSISRHRIILYNKFSRSIPNNFSMMS